MNNLQIDVEKDGGKYGELFSIVGLRDLIKKMAEEGKTKVDLLNVDLDDIQNILMWYGFYYKIDEAKQLKDTV